MNIMKKLVILLFTILCFSFVIVKNTYALSDITVTFTNESSSASGGAQIFGSSLESYEQYTEYPYLVVEISPTRTINVSGTNVAQPFGYFRTDCQTYLIPYAGKAFYYLSHNSSTCRSNIPVWNGAMNFASLLGDGETLSFTLTQNVPNCNCPDPLPPEPCVHDENSHYVQVVMDSFWNYHTAFAGSVVALIAIFLVYRIIKGRLR